MSNRNPRGGVIGHCFIESGQLGYIVRSARPRILICSWLEKARQY
jgi:hypothetical protein